MSEKTTFEEIGKAFVWALKEGLINTIAVESLVKKYKEMSK